MTSSADAQTRLLASYVPREVISRISADPLAEHRAELYRFPAAAIFADISGFTTLTEQSARTGELAVEALTAELNAYFGQLIDIIVEYGGDIVTFAGDALLAVWPAPDGRLALSAQHAVHCALQLVDSRRLQQPGFKTRLKVKIAVGAGETMALKLGGFESQWWFALCGDPLRQISDVSRHALEGQVVVHSDSWKLIGTSFVAEPISDNAAYVAGTRTVASPTPLSPVELKPEFATPLRAYVSKVVLGHADVGQTRWLSEVRQVTAVFIKLLGVDSTSAEFLARTAALAHTVQEVIGTHRGNALVFRVDDKGMVAIASFGLPPHVYEDDASRAIEAALDLQERLRKLGCGSAIGICTGRLLCGPIGNDLRREYTMYGNSVNLAARLMSTARANEILCDSATFNLAHRAANFERLPEFTLKGLDSSVPVYRPRPVTRSSTSELIGREDCSSTIRESLEALGGGSRGALILEGTPGMGKSRLVEEVVRQADARGIQCLIGECTERERSTPYAPWRQVFASAIEKQLGSTRLVEPNFRAYLQDDSKLIALLPLIKTVINVEIPENDLTSVLKGSVRADNTHAVLTRLLRWQTGDAPFVLILEDCHWMDSSSWALVLRAFRTFENALIVLVSRPMEAVPTEYEQIRHGAHTKAFTIGGLSSKDASSLAAQLCGAQTLSEGVATFIAARAEGNPLFIQQLTNSLRDSDLITVEEGVCRARSGVGDLQSAFLPSSLQAVVNARIETLALQERLVLKVASAIGRVFSLETLRSVHATPGHDHLGEQIEGICKAGLLEKVEPFDDGIYRFNHVITQEVAYSSMLFAQRRELHRAIAEHLEREALRGNESPPQALAHHWSMAGEEAKAIEYLDRASAQAIRNFSNRETIDLLQQLLTACAAQPHDIDAHTIARWEKQLGQAFLAVGSLADSAEYLGKALRALHKPLPGSAASLVVELLRAAAVQVWTMCRPRRGGTSVGNKERPYYEAAGAYESLGQLYYHAGSRLRAIHSAMSQLNLTERLSPSPQLARAYANMCIAASLGRIRRLADFYAQRARSVAAEVRNPHTSAVVLIRIGHYEAGKGRWALAQEAFEQALEFSGVASDQRRGAEAKALLAVVHFFCGRFAQSRTLLSEVHEQGVHVGDLQQQAWGTFWRAQASLRLGLVVDADLELATAMSVTAPQDTMGILFINGLRAATKLRLNQPEDAWQYAATAVATMTKVSATSFTTFEGYCGTAHVLLALLAAADKRDHQRVRQLTRAAGFVCTRMAAVARLFPVALPRATLYAGSLAWFTNRPRKAVQRWRDSLAAAQTLEMPYDEACACLELGRHGVADPAAHLETAKHGFARLGAHYETQLCERALEFAGQISTLSKKRKKR